MMQKSITYFEESGPINTEATLLAAKARADELGIHQIVVASSHGSTALRAKEIFGKDSLVIAVAISASLAENGWCLTDPEKQALQEHQIPALTATLALGDDFGEAFGVVSPASIVRETLYTFSQGTIVAVEITLMAADAGLIRTDQEMIAIAGSGSGADTALVMQPAFTRKFKDLRIREIIAKPR